MDKKIINTALGFLLFMSMFSMLFAQERVEDLVEKIDLKLRKDRNYLNIHFIPIYAQDDINPLLTSIPRVSKNEPFSFIKDENISYRIIFLNEGLGVDSLYLLYVDEIRVNTSAEGGFFTAIGDVTDDTTVVLKFSDLYNLQQNNPEYYYALQKIVSEFIRLNEDSPPQTLLRINTEGDIKTSLGVTSRDNADFINYAKTYEIHWFKDESATSSRRGRTSGTTSFKLDASASDISFSHEAMNAILEDGGASVEVDFKQPVVNVLPHQGMTLRAGLKMLFMLAGDKRGINNSTFLNAKFGARINLGTRDLYDAQPYIFGDPPRLNFGTGIFGQFNFSKMGNFPYMNFYFATGDRDVTDPAVFVFKGLRKYAYHTFNEAEISMSFYWNTSDALTSRFRMDVGGGYYDVVESEYNNKTGSLLSTKQVFAKFQPMLAIHYTWAPRSNPVMGARLKFFDSTFNFLSWLTVFQIAPDHLFRLEAIYISAPFFRDSYSWETEGGAMVQIRYRYGLNN